MDRMLETTKVSIIEGMETRGGSAPVEWLLRSRHALVRIVAFTSLVRAGTCEYKSGKLLLKEYNRE